MKPSLLVFALLGPQVAHAQQTGSSGTWSVAVAAGMGFGWSHDATRGTSYALSVGRTLSARVTVRGVAEMSVFQGQTLCGPVYTVDNPDSTAQTYCTSGFGENVASVSVGADAALVRADRGPFVSARLGIYNLASARWPQGGAYVGAGLALPVSFGAVTLEAGVHSYFRATGPGHGWVVPLRVGLRWRP